MKVSGSATRSRTGRCIQGLALVEVYKAGASAPASFQLLQPLPHVRIDTRLCIADCSCRTRCQLSLIAVRLTGTFKEDCLDALLANYSSFV